MAEKELKKQRKTIKQTLTRIKTYVSEFDTTTSDHHNLRTREQKVEELWRDYNKIQTTLEDISENHEEDRVAFEETYFDTKAAIQRILSVPPPSERSVYSPIESSKPSMVKLPEIQIPTFTGNFQQWNNFHDIFRSIIHENTEISPVQKLYYLKGAVKGEAAQIIEAITPTPSNYEVAWNLLKERYDNKEFIINSHLKALFELPPVTRGAVSNLRNLITVSKQHLRSLEAMGLPVTYWDTIILYLLTSKLDNATRQAWQLHKNNFTLPTLVQFHTFLEQKCSALEIFSNSDKPHYSQPNTKATFHTTTTSTQNYQIYCKVCKGSHHLFKCDKFLKLSIAERIKIVQETGACFNCLKFGHSAKDCKNFRCRECRRNHHTLIHLENTSNKTTTENKVATLESNPEKPQMIGSVSLFNSQEHISQILLSTAVIRVRDFIGQWHDARVLLDAASQSNFVTQTFLDKLRITPQRANIQVNGISETPAYIKNQTSLVVSSKTENYEQELNFLVIKQITNVLPIKKVRTQGLNIPKNITLADPEFHKPQRVDLLLGAEIFYDILQDGKRTLGVDMPILQQTKFGWTIAGKIPKILETGDELNKTHTFFTMSLEEKLTHFWRIENSYTEKKIFTQEEKRCEELFEKTVRRDKDGRYIVTMPIKNKEIELGDSFREAHKRFLSLEKRLTHHPELYDEYRKFMQEYRDLGHMEQIVAEQGNTKTVYYIPHHCVIKPESTSTKLRVVFDGSMKTTNKKSLNDNLLTGPTIHEELFSIILRFRTHKIVFITDVKKMFRQILLTTDQTDLQRILWRDNPENELEIYRLLTITYGLTPSPYLATKAVHQLAKEEFEKYPLAAKIVLEDMYVDDILSGTEDLATALEVQRQLKDLFHAGGLELHKWSSNNTTFLNSLHQDEIEKTTTVDIQDEQVKTLGLIWQPREDKFRFRNNIGNEKQEYTKRVILGEIASLFDPLGIFGPVVVRAKLFMKELWKLGLDWDVPIHGQFLQNWLLFRQQLLKLAAISINRCIIEIENPVSLELHGFADSSELAYGACTYIRASDKIGNTTVTLICSKSRVAPMKPLTLPRLELCATLILARLMYKVKSSLKLKKFNTYLWTDSTVTLSWISSTPHRWKTFIANRVAEIQELTVDDEWNHVPSEENPADPLSRGVSVEYLQQLPLWWNGPHWLSTMQRPKKINYAEDTTELKSNETCLLTTITQWSVFTRFSSFSKLQRVMTYCLRFVYNLRHKTDKRVGYLQTNELQNSLYILLKIVQEETFSSEINDIKANNNINKKSKLITLNPFLDTQGILRVGGRIKNSLLPYAQRHQAILPEKHPFTLLLIQHEHKRLLHAGIQAVLYSLRQKYWIIGGRNEVRQVIHNCMICFKFQAKTASQVMGDLPDVRVQPIRPFYKTGVDYGGPFLVKRSKCSRNTFDKIYIALFICMATKAIHLEIVTSLSTEDFINSLRRFISRRGRCHTIFSDNATTFKGAQNQLNDLYKFFKSQKVVSSIQNFATSEGMEWKFIPPRAPNFGGLWEAGIRSVKHHIKRVLGEAKISMEDFNTLLIQIECCVNSRPISPIHDDPSDMSILTPGHFLIGEPLTQIPEHNLSDIPMNRLTRFQLIQNKLQHFWKRWNNEYLTSLQQRYKWNQGTCDVYIGALVLIREEGIGPCNWLRGRVTAIHPGQDGRIRVVTLKTPTGILQRPVRKLCLLPMQKEEI